MNNTFNNDEEESRKLPLSELEQTMLATFEKQVVQLAQQSAEGVQDADVQLAALLSGIPDGVRSEILKRFRELVQDLRQESGAQMELTPQMQEQLRIHKENERMLIANWLSEKTLEKIRNAILAHQGLLEQIVNLGQELHKKGVFVENIGTRVQRVEMGAIFSPAKEKDGRGRG